MRMPMLGYNDAYRTGGSKRWPVLAHVRREFFDLYQSTKLPVAGEAVLRIQKLYDVETQARVLPASERVALRQEYAKPIFDDLEVWLKEQLGQISRQDAAGQSHQICTRAPAQRRALISTTGSLN